MNPNPDTPQPRNKILLGVLLILATAFTISVQDVVFKLFSSEMSLWQIFALRGCLAVPVLIALNVYNGLQLKELNAVAGKWVILRAILITGTFLAFYAAIPFLSLSTVGAANYIAPIFVALLSAYVIREPVGIYGWLGVLLGFAGVVVLLQPGTDAFSAWALLPVLGAALYALAHIVTRTKCQNEPLAIIALAQNGIMLLAGLVVTLLIISTVPPGELTDAYPYIFGGWSAISLADWGVLSLLAGFSIILAMMLAAAYKVAPPSVVSTFEYSYLVFVAAWDVLFFGIAIGSTTLMGMAMIVVAGLLVLRRTQKN